MKAKFEVCHATAETYLNYVKCPKCKKVFGLSCDFMEKTQEVNIQYTCPYCRHESGLKENITF
jgi:primosomal protein N'